MKAYSNYFRQLKAAIKLLLSCIYYIIIICVTYISIPLILFYRHLCDVGQKRSENNNNS
jgi:hypothetical protein